MFWQYFWHYKQFGSGPYLIPFFGTDNQEHQGLYLVLSSTVDEYYCMNFSISAGITLKKSLISASISSKKINAIFNIIRIMNTKQECFIIFCELKS